MQVVKEYPDGLFCWIDLSTPDLAGAKAFYSGLFGWVMEDVFHEGHLIYTNCTIDGNRVAGMGQMDPEMQAQGMPPIWTSYVKHDDVDAIVAKAQAAGGTVMFPPMDVMEEGRMTIIQDPVGAVFGVWQPKRHIGAQLVNTPNTLVWNELQAHDLEAAKTFYAATFGWTYETDANGYVAIFQDKRVQAGMMKIQESWGDVPPNWGLYIMVEDVRAAVAKVEELGGRVLVPVSSAGELGEFAVILDPQGGAMTVMQFNGPVDAPPGY